METKREIVIRQGTEGEIIHRIDITGRSEHSSEKALMGVLRNMRDDCWASIEPEFDEGEAAP